MNPNYPSSSMYDDLSRYQNMPDLLEEFLSQILDAPDVLPNPTPTYAATSALAPAPVPTAIPANLHHLRCHWVSQNNPSAICGAPLSSDPKRACAHLRLVHKIRGNDKAIVGCQWHACRASPMQRGSVIRHVLAVHLGLLRWQCEVCGKVFSRKGTGHLCGGGEDA